MTNIKQVLLGMALTGLIATPALASFNITRMTTVVDDFSGSYTVTTTSTMEEGGVEGVAQAEFNNFHPRGENATLSGTLMDEFERSEGSVESSASADLAMNGSNPETGEARSLSVSFQDLRVERNPEGVEISGEVTVNGEVFDANDLPERVGGFLRRVFWLIRR